MYHRGSHRTDFREIWNWKFIWQTCGEKTNLIKFGQKYFTWKPRYVLSIPVKLNRHKSALFERNCIELLEQPRRYKHNANANAPQCYVTHTFPTFLSENGYNKFSTKIIIPIERLSKRPECKTCTPNYNIQYTPFSLCSSLFVCITAHGSVVDYDVDSNVTTLSRSSLSNCKKICDDMCTWRDGTDQWQNGFCAVRSGHNDLQYVQCSGFHLPLYIANHNGTCKLLLLQWVTQGSYRSSCHKRQKRYRRFITANTKAFHWSPKWVK